MGGRGATSRVVESTDGGRREIEEGREACVWERKRSKLGRKERKRKRKRKRFS